mgnify:CR=1 FL=1
MLFNLICASCSKEFKTECREEYLCPGCRAAVSESEAASDLEMEKAMEDLFQTELEEEEFGWSGRSE